MDSIIGSFDGLIKQAKNNYLVNNRIRTNNWKHCVLLSKKGWSCRSFETIDGSKDIIFRWEKGDRFIKIKLNFTEQCYWINYLESKK